MAYKKWIVADADKEKASALSEKLNIDPFIAFLLVSRGIDDELTASEFLTDSCRFVSPFSFVDMDKAVKRINSAIENDENICVYGDYDCDGVTSTTLLVNFFESLGASVSYYIPHRVNDGYGMNMSAIDEIKSRGTDLIVTVDNGISAYDEAEYIYSLGMELVITDHHQLGDKLPRAEAVVNPHRADNKLSFVDFAGVGVAFKLACALYDGETEEMLEQYADLVAIGTIADVVSLRGENRSLVKAGLELINNAPRIGIDALKEVAGCGESLSSTDVAFQLAPRINAAGRMDTAFAAVELLLCEDYDEARFKAEQLNIENSHRHQVESSIMDSLDELIASNPSLVEDRVIVLEGDGFHKGVIGICASHIVDRFGKPAIVLGVDDEGEATGSARSIEGFNIYEAISSCGELLTHFGGHPLAAGLGIKAEDIDTFRNKINAFAEKYYPVMPAQTLNIDCKLSPFYLGTELVDSLEALEPYGAENAQPVFGLYNFKLISVSPTSDGKHTKLELSKKGKSIRAVMFRKIADTLPYKAGDNVDLAVKLAKNFFKGRYYLSVNVIDIRKNGINFDKYFLEKSDYELFILGKANKTNMYPTRSVCSIVYKYIRNNNGWNFTVDDLYFNLDSFMTYGQLCFALTAFEQAGLISRSEVITINKVSEKKQLEDTDILKSLKGRLEIE